MRKAERAWLLSGGEESEALGINGARPHFLYENVLFLTKWGLAPFIPWGKSNVLWNHIALAFLQWPLHLFPKTFVLNKATNYYGNKNAYYFRERPLRSQG